MQQNHNLPDFILIEMNCYILTNGNDRRKE